MNMVKRGLIALSVVAAVGGTTGGLLASAASASPTRGPEILTGSQYEVGDGVAVGPFTEHGVVHNRGNVTDIPSLPTDPANSNRHTLVDPTGSFTLLTTGGRVQQLVPVSTRLPVSSTSPSVTSTPRSSQARVLMPRPPATSRPRHRSAGSLCVRPPGPVTRTRTTRRRSPLRTS